VFGEDTIIFEYGAESGELEPPFDWVQVAGGSGGYIQTVTSPKRTANRSITFYVAPDGSSDASRRARIWKYQDDFDTKYLEFYLSYWIYFPAEDPWTTSDSDGWGTTFGGWSMWFGPSGESSWSYRTGGSFRMKTGTSRELRYRYSWRDFPTDGSDGFTVDTGLYADDELSGVWTQLQHYVKITEGTDSIIRAWVNDDLIFEKTTWTELGFTCADPRGYSEWSSQNCRWASSTRDGYPNFKLGLYDDDDSKDNRILIDDIVWSTERVPSSYGVGGVTVAWESVEFTFESGTFSDWDGIDWHDGGLEPSITSTEQYSGVYSANFTVDGSTGSTSRVHSLVQNRSEVFIRSHVWYSELPDSNNTRVMCTRIDTTGATYIASVGIYRMDANYYWCIRHTSGGNPPQNYTLATINPQTWYSVEFYVNVTANGNFTVWVDDVLMCQTLGDYSSLAPLSMVLAYANVYGAQSDGKTVLHDNYRVDDVRIGEGTPVIIDVEGEEEEPTEDDNGDKALTTFVDSLSGILVNGTYPTDTSGHYEFANLTYNQEYLFIIDLPTGYQPRWVKNFNGSFSWNGTHFLVYHTVTESHTGYIGVIYTSGSNDPYISEATGQILTVFTSYSSSSRIMFLNMTAASVALIQTRERFTPSYYDVSGATDWFWIGLDYTFEVEGTSEITVEWR